MTTEVYRESFERRTKTVRYLRFLEGLADTQVGPIFLGMWGTVALFSYLLSAFITAVGFGEQVGWNPIRFVSCPCSRFTRRRLRMACSLPHCKRAATGRSPRSSSLCR